MDINKSRELFLNKNTRQLCGKGKLFVFLTCGALTYAWANHTFPNPRKYSTKIDKCSINDNIQFNDLTKKKYPDKNKEITNNSIFPENLFPYFNIYKKSSEDIQQKENNDKINAILTENEIESHLRQLSIPKDDIKQVIKSIQSRKENVEISNVLNELIKNGKNNKLTITTDKAIYEITGQHTSGSIYQYNTNEGHITNNKFIYTELEVDINPKIKQYQQSDLRVTSYFITGLSTLMGISAYNGLASKMFGKVKGGNIRTMAANVGLACLFSFVIASPMQIKLKRNYEKKYKYSSIDIVPDLRCNSVRNKFVINSNNSIPSIPENKINNLTDDIVSWGFSYGTLTYISGYMAGIVLGIFMAL